MTLSLILFCNTSLDNLLRSILLRNTFNDLEFKLMSIVVHIFIREAIAEESFLKTVYNRFIEKRKGNYRKSPRQLSLSICV